MSAVIKLSSRATNEYWEIPVLYEDEHLLALDKPSGLLTSPDRYDAGRPSLINLLHSGILEGKPWAKERGLTYLMNAHRPDSETTGVILLARSKPVLVGLANLFGTDKPARTFVALVQGTPEQERFEVHAKLAPHPVRVRRMHVDAKRGKRAKTVFTVLERFTRATLLKCEPATWRPHQIRVHLRYVGLPIFGDELYGGKPLWLSRLKPDFRLKPHHTERPLISRAAVHAEELTVVHPVTGQPLTIRAPWPKDLTVAVKYLRKYAQVLP